MKRLWCAIVFVAVLCSCVRQEPGPSASPPGGESVCVPGLTGPSGVYAWTCENAEGVWSCPDDNQIKHGGCVWLREGRPAERPAPPAEPLGSFLRDWMQVPDWGDVWSQPRTGA